MPNALLGVFKPTPSSPTESIGIAGIGRPRVCAGQLARASTADGRLRVRLTPGGYYDTRKSTAGFYELTGIGPTRRGCTYPVCATRVPGARRAPLTTSGRSTSRTRRFCTRPRSSAILSQALVRRSTAWCTTAIRACGRAVLDYAPLVAAPQGGFAWDINGDGKQALRTSAGLLCDSPTRKLGELRRRPAVFLHPRAQWASLSDIENFATSNIAFVETPVTAECSRRRTTVAREVLQRERDLSA